MIDMLIIKFKYNMLFKLVYIFIFSMALTASFSVNAQYKQNKPRLNTISLNLQIENTLIVAKGVSPINSSKSFMSSLVLHYLSRSEQSKTVFGKRWCPILRTDTAPSLMPLDWGIFPNNNKNAITLAYCQDGNSSLDFVLLESASSPLNGRSMIDIIAGKIFENEEFNFVLQGSKIAEPTRNDNLQNFNKNNQKLTRLNFTAKEVFGFVYQYQTSFRISYFNKILAFNDGYGLTYFPGYDAQGRFDKLTYKTNGSLYDNNANNSEGESPNMLFKIDFSNENSDFVISSFNAKESLGSASFKIANGNILEIRNIWNNIYKFNYDNEGRLARVAYPDGSSESYFYTPKGNSQINQNTISTFIARDKCAYLARYLFSTANNYKTIVEKSCNGEKFVTIETTVTTDLNTGKEQVMEVVLNKDGLRVVVDKPISELNPWEVK